LPENYFPDAVADRYDDEVSGFEPTVLDPTVDFLVERARGGPVLELGIGTGRVAVPLARRGLRVHGIDLSEAMVKKLKEKPEGAVIDVTIGDFATANVAGKFTLAYLVCNTIMNLTTQDLQVACFRNVARHLEPEGCFVIEVGLPDLQRLPFGEKLRIFDFSDTHIGIDEYDVANQGLVSHHFTRRDGTFEQRSIPFRYVWPAELDLMARLAGLTLRERWSGWQHEPFTSTSEKLVAVWEKTTAAEPAAVVS
jgi:SAM-dependent methyltransferase